MSAKRRAPEARAGWREWVALPGLGISSIKAKLDTGARSSALHVSNLTPFERDHETWLRFDVHPLQRDSKHTLTAEAVAVDQREIRSSSGHAQTRWVIRTELLAGGQRWPIELTLTSRDEMGFRLLLGRQSLRDHYLVDASSSFLLGRPETKEAP